MVHGRSGSWSVGFRCCGECDGRRLGFGPGFDFLGNEPVKK